jgi:hypothetical protein
MSLFDGCYAAFFVIYRIFSIGQANIDACVKSSQLAFLPAISCIMAYIETRGIFQMAISE